ncbi:hypothetical protein LIER_04136 [Lithospermum erythrorhizon]|uniref:non-specific serine/threonine protein kinase n=1 Tax=Lithospermum erythrorhizon TaxID=34254 RepID=A0AAV3NVM3_LITER
MVLKCFYFLTMGDNQFWDIVFLLLIISIPCSYCSLSFNLSQIGTDHANSAIRTTGDAYISNQGVQVTPDERYMSQGKRTGRATYIEPLHLWDKASGNMTNFSTQFSFVIDSRGNNVFGDGLTFFLAHNGSTIPANAPGSGLGLTDSNSMLNSTQDPFVAVEFDTYWNYWDPDIVPHVGININSMKSARVAYWKNNVSEGEKCDVWISYSSIAKNLTVSFTGFWNGKRKKSRTFLVVDLREYLPEWVTFGFSAATGDFFEKHNVKSWVFSSSLIVGDSDDDELTSPSPYNPEPVVLKTQKKTGQVVGLSLGLSGLVLVFIGATYFMWKKKKRNQMIKEGDTILDLSRDSEFQKVCGAKKFSYSELSRATSNFSEKDKLGEGGFGGVYRGLLKESNMFVAVKRVSKESKQGEKEYASEVKIISQLRHRNLVQLVGWCHEKRELLLVYEFMPNGSLDSHLFKENSFLSWELRYKIAKGLASALLYLHEEWEQCVVHRDIKSSNIMLDSHFNAKLGDFGLARLVDHDKGSQTTMLAGTMGYMAPEYVIVGKASKESDVYSFGIVALEIACGRKPIDLKAPEEQVSLVQWAWELYGTGKLFDAIDKKLTSNYDMMKEMERLIVVALWCAHPDNKLRPSIRQAIHVLKFEAQLPILEPKMPMPTYFSPLRVFTSMFTEGQFTEGSTQMQPSSIVSSTNSSNFTPCSSASSSRSLLHTR